MQAAGCSKRVCGSLWGIRRHREHKRRRKKKNTMSVVKGLLLVNTQLSLGEGTGH